MQPIPDEERQRIVRMYVDQQMPSTEVAAQTGRSLTGVVNALRRAGVTRTHAEQGRLIAERGLCTRIGTHHDFFDALSPESAWILGLIFGDGWIQRNAVAVSGSEEVVSKVRDLVAPKGSVYKTPTCHQITVSSVRIVRLLAERYGIHPNKSKTMLFPEVPPVLLPHFVRGLWDSDGSLAWNNQRGRRYLLAIYASASRAFVEKLADALVTHAGMPRRPVEAQIRGPRSCYVVRYGDAATAHLCEWMYADSAEHMRCGKRFSRHTERQAAKERKNQVKTA